MKVLHFYFFFRLSWTQVALRHCTQPFVCAYAFFFAYILTYTYTESHAIYLLAHVHSDNIFSQVPLPFLFNTIWLFFSENFLKIYSMAFVKIIRDENIKGPLKKFWEFLRNKFVFQVTQQHAGQYQCQPFNQRGSSAPSPIIQVIIKDPPTLLSRPNAEYIKNVGGKVSFSCQAAGTPTPDIRWRRVRTTMI